MKQRYRESQSWPGTSHIFLVVMRHRIMLCLTFFQASSLFWLFRVTRHASKTNFTSSKVFLRSSSTLMLASTSTPPPGEYLTHPCGQPPPSSLGSYSTFMLAVNLHPPPGGQCHPSLRSTYTPSGGHIPPSSLRSASTPPPGGQYHPSLSSWQSSSYQLLLLVSYTSCLLLMCVHKPRMGGGELFKLSDFLRLK